MNLIKKQDKMKRKQGYKFRCDYCKFCSGDIQVKYFKSSMSANIFVLYRFLCGNFNVYVNKC